MEKVQKLTIHNDVLSRLWRIPLKKTCSSAARSRKGIRFT